MISAAEPINGDASSDGIKGIALMVPAIGLPLAFHLLNGAIATGAGILALSAALAPFGEELAGLIRLISPNAGQLSTENATVANSAQKLPAVALEESVQPHDQTP